MLKTRDLLLAASAILVTACSTTSVSQPTGSSAPTAVPPTPATSGSTPATSGAPMAAHTCPEGQFVACHDGETCATRGGSFLEPKRCFTRAAEACSNAACEFGCDIYLTHVGGPKLVLCAANANSTGRMKVCGGIANWGCPEGMRCAFGTTPGFDQQGTCVPTTSGS